MRWIEPLISRLSLNEARNPGWGAKWLDGYPPGLEFGGTRGGSSNSAPNFYLPGAEGLGCTAFAGRGFTKALIGVICRSTGMTLPLLMISL